MKKSALTAGIIILSGLGLAFAGSPAAPQAAQTAPVKQEGPKVKEFKYILFQLVRQDNYLDEATDKLDSANGSLSVHEITAMGLNLKLIAGNLNKVSELNKTQFAAIRPGSALSKYTNAILSYSNKVLRKSAQVNTLAARLAAQNKKTGLRDAVSSAKNGRKAHGKNISQLIEERKALAALAADARTLRAASRELSATSKWLYIASE